MAHPNPDWKKGMKKVKKSGRKKGTPNKFTSLKQSFLDAFQDKDIGGTQGLIEVYKKNDMRKMEFFKLLTKLFPTSITAGDENDGEPLMIIYMPVKKEKSGEDKK